MRKSNKRKKPRRNLGFWLQVWAAILVGIGTFLTGLSDILKIFLKPE
ncbi:hypothetical protein II906_10270 [bacterium]|nr:hypothetical protein [bacterium]